MAVIETVVEIARSPAEVRAVILDFDHLHEWHKSFLKLIKPLPEGKTPEEMKGGDDMLLKFLASPAMKVKCVENTPECLAWSGGPSLLFHGVHSIKLEGVENGAKTRIRHGETFTGLFGEGVALPGIKGNVAKLYEGFNRDLKKRCEEGVQANGEV